MTPYYFRLCKLCSLRWNFVKSRISTRIYRSFRIFFFHLEYVEARGLNLFIVFGDKLNHLSPYNVPTEWVITDKSMFTS